MNDNTSADSSNVSLQHFGKVFAEFDRFDTVVCQITKEQRRETVQTITNAGEFLIQEVVRLRQQIVGEETLKALIDQTAESFRILQCRYDAVIADLIQHKAIVDALREQIAHLDGIASTISKNKSTLKKGGE